MKIFSDHSGRRHILRAVGIIKTVDFVLLWRTFTVVMCYQGSTNVR